MNQIDFFDEDVLHEECGVFGMYDLDGNDVASTIYYGLFALQHRGQESCGIAVSDTEGPKGRVSTHKGMGLCNEVFTPDTLESLHGNIGVGHVRYSTAGSSTRENAQPLVLNYIKGTLALAHNGNLVNAPELRRELEYSGAIFQTTIDSEVVAYHIARERVNTSTVEEAVANAMKKIKGAYALVIMSPRKMIGARIRSALSPFASERGTMPISWLRKPALWKPSARSLCGMWSRERLWPLPLRELPRIRACAWLTRKSRPDVCLSTFISPDRTVFWMASAYIIPGFMRDAAWQRIRRWRRILW